MRCEIAPRHLRCPEQLREVVKAAREAGATGIWTNLLFLRPGTREHFLEHLAQDWPELLPLPQAVPKPRLSPGRRDDARPTPGLRPGPELGVADRRIHPAEPARDAEQLALEV